MKQHKIWFKTILNPLLRLMFKLEICSLIKDEKVIGFGIRKYYKN
jgi:hypothetical protein